MVHPVVISGLYAEHLFLISQIIVASLYQHYQSPCSFVHGFVIKWIDPIYMPEFTVLEGSI